MIASGGQDTAAARPPGCLVAGEAALRYALLARLLGSPHDWDAATVAEIGELCTWARASAPQDAPLAALLDVAESLAGSQGDWPRRYSALFEVGSAGPPLPIREELTASASGGSKEEVVRFYDHFGYEMAAEFAWAPDHLAPMLEFLGWLAGLESASDATEERLSLRLAQRDFAALHLWHWLPSLALAVRSRDDAGPYVPVLNCLEATLCAERTRLADDVEVA